MIKIQNLSVGYGREDVLKDIDITIPKGQIVALLGPNGCGKSTLIKCLARQISTPRGGIYLNDMHIKEFSPKEYAKKVSYLKQTRETPHITVGSLVLHGRFPYMGFPRVSTQADKDIAKAAMIQTGAYSLRNQMLTELSGGECQKAYLAMTIAQNSDLLLLDEPTNNLDIKYQLEFLHILKQLKSQGKTILVALHDINAALNVADSICILLNGKLEFFGNARSIEIVGIIQNAFGVSVEMSQSKDNIFMNFSLI